MGCMNASQITANIHQNWSTAFSYGLLALELHLKLYYLIDNYIKIIQIPAAHTLSRGTQGL